MSETKIYNLKLDVSKIMRARAEHMEMFCAAFIREAGPGSVHDYELVEQIENNPEDGIIQRVTWKFRRRPHDASGDGQGHGHSRP